MSPENSKPEWFQMAQADAPELEPRSRRTIRSMTLAIPLRFLSGLFGANSVSPLPVER